MGNRFLWWVFVSDMAALAAAIVLGSIVVFDTPLFWRSSLRSGESMWPLLGLLVGGGVLGSYGSRLMWRRRVPRVSYGRALSIVSFSGIFAALGVFVVRAYWSRSFVAITLASWALLALAHRTVRRRRPWTERMVLVTREKGLAEHLSDADHAKVLEVLDPGGEPPQSLDPSVMLAVDLGSVLSNRMARFVSSWNLAGNAVRSLTAVYEEHTGRLPIVHLVEGWELSTPVSRNEYAPIKRGIDTFLVLVTLPLWLVLAVAIWVAVKLDSPGPAIYRQTRVGKGGSLFTLYKFRSMHTDAEDLGPRFAVVQDERLTRVGAFLRRVHLDEIPQLWNVLRGDLSLVGPRPERPEFTSAFEKSIPFYAYRTLVRPGVTGWAQVIFGYADDEAGAIEKLTYDLYYVKHMSPWMDAQVLGSSLWTVVSGFGR